MDKFSLHWICDYIRIIRLQHCFIFASHASDWWRHSQTRSVDKNLVTMELSYFVSGGFLQAFWYSWQRKESIYTESSRVVHSVAVTSPETRKLQLLKPLSLYLRPSVSVSCLTLLQFAVQSWKWVWGGKSARSVMWRLDRYLRVHIPDVSLLQVPHWQRDMDHQDWMSALPEQLWDFPLTDLAIPGTFTPFYPAALCCCFLFPSFPLKSTKISALKWFAPKC